MRPPKKRRLRGRHMVALAMVAAVLAGCGGSTSTTSATPTAATGDRVSIDHRFGTTVIDGTPERIVSLDTQWTDVLVALDAPLVGAASDPTIEGGRYPWQADFPATVAEVTVPKALAIPFEGVAALHPDLIVVTWAVTDRADYDKLSRIAPTIPLLDEREVETWEQMAQAAGRILGRPDAASALIADVDAQVTAFAEELPGLAGTTYAFVNYVAGDGFTVVTDPDDGSAQLFSKLGMVIAPDLVDAGAGASGRVKLSLENIDDLDADVLIMLTNGSDPAQIPGFDDLPAVRSGAVALVDYADAVALNTPTPLSIPSVLESIRPALEASIT